MAMRLLPCWKCGEEGSQLYVVKTKLYAACSFCPTVSPIFTSPLAAAKAWNDAYLEHRDRQERTQP